MPPFHSEGVAVQPEDMVRIDGADSGLEPIIERRQAPVLRVAGLVERVVSRDPGVSTVVSGKLLPEPDSAVLVVFVVPEGGVVSRVVGVPVAVLAAGSGVHVEDGVEALGGAEGDDAVEVLEAVGLEDARVHVVFEVSVVEGDADAV